MGPGVVARGDGETLVSATVLLAAGRMRRRVGQSRNGNKQHKWMVCLTLEL